MIRILSLMALIAAAPALSPTGIARAADCSAAVRQAEAQTGGQAIGAPRVQQNGGQTVCVVTVLITDPSGQNPPARRTISIPAN